jgi:ribokinase
MLNPKAFQMIIVFGSMNIDIVTPVRDFPKPGETVLCASDYLSRPGGKGANQAIAAQRAGGKTVMVGKVGDDAFGRRAVHNLKTQGIWTTGIGISDERPTGCATIAVNATGENAVIVAPGANLAATSDQVPDEALLPKNIVLTQLEVEPKETFSVLARAHARGCTTILNASPAGLIPKESLPDIDYLIVNEIEALQFAAGIGIPDTDPLALARKIAAAGNHTCIVTMSGKGAVAANREGLYHIGALEVEVVDTTGAGDAFCGIFAASLLAGDSWLSALRRASAGAGLSCSRLGAQEGTPAKEDIDANLSKLAPAQKIG